MLKLLPLQRQMQHYQQSDFYSDCIASVIVAIVLVPQAIAYAELAGLPSSVGLLAAVLPVATYALLGSSRTLSVGPVAITSLMTYTALSDLPPGTHLAAAASLLALQISLCLLILATLNAGTITHFISHSVISGFTTAAALLIIIGQLKHLADLASWQQFAPNYWALALGMLTLFVLLSLNSHKFSQLWLTFFPEQLKLGNLLPKSGPLFAILICTSLAATLPKGTLPLAGPVNISFNLQHLTQIDWDLFLFLLPKAVLLALICYLESIAIGRMLASRRRERLNPNQELWALSASNAVSALSGSYPVAGGFGRSMVNATAGAQTQIASLLAAIWVAALTFSIGNLFAMIPKAVLAGIVIMAASSLINFNALPNLWRYSRMDATVWLLTVLGVILHTVETGLIVGTLASLVFFLIKSSQPHCAVVGRVPGTHQFRNKLHYETEHLEGVLFIRIDESLFFANVTKVEDFINAQIAKRPHVNHLILIGSAINGIDSDGVELLEQLETNLSIANIQLHLAEFKGVVLDQLSRSGWFKQWTPKSLFLSAQDAYLALEPH